MRHNFAFQFHCSKCGGFLSAVLETKTRQDEKLATKFGADSAYEIRGRIMIEPCRNCISELTEPARMIQEGLKKLAEAESE